MATNTTLGGAPSSLNSPFYNSNTGPTSTFNPTMAIIIIVLIAAFFLMGFFSIFVRRCIRDDSETVLTRRRSMNASKLKNRGLDQETVESLPVVHLKELGEHEDHECAVCLTDFEPDDNLRLLPSCKHVFHQECIDAWFNSHSTCPLCRASLLPLQDEKIASGESVTGAVGEADTPHSAVEDGEAGVGAVLGDAEELGSESHRGVTIEEGGDATSLPITREDERFSARLVLFRNSESFKRAARGIAAHERAATSATTSENLEKTSSFNRRKPPNTPMRDSIRRSSSLGTDLKSLRDCFIGGEGTQQNGESNMEDTDASTSKQGATRGAWFSRAESMDSVAARKGAEFAVNPREHWVTIDLDSAATSSAAPSSKAKVQLTPSGSESVRSERWSISSLKGVMFPLKRSASDLVQQEDQHVPV